MFKDFFKKYSPRFVALLAVILILGSVYIFYTWNSTKEEIFQTALRLAESIEVSFPEETLQKLQAVPSDTALAEYKIIKNILGRIVHVNSDAKFAYLYKLRGNKIYFIADSEPDTSKNYSPPGQEYSEADPVYFKPFEAGSKAFITDPTQDRWGNWVSVLVPLEDAAGKTLAVFRLDYNKDDWDNLLLLRLLRSISSVFLLFFLLVLMVYTTRRNNSLKREVTRRELSEAELANSNERFQNMFRKHSSIMLLVEPGTGRILDANAAASRFYGYSLEELKNRTINSINVLTKSEIEADMKQAAIEKRNNFIFPHRLASGEIRTVEVFSSPIELENHTVLFSIIYDISDRKHAETKLRESEENFRIFFNTITDFLFVLDEQGNIITANDTVYNRLKYAPEELFEKSVLMVHPEERRAEAGGIVVAMLEGTADFCPVPIVAKDNVQIPVETRVSKGIWNGKPALFGVSKDISALQLSEEKFSKVFYLNPSVCGITELETGIYVEVNDAFTTLLGFTKSEAIGKSPIELGIFSKEARERLLNQGDESGEVHSNRVLLKTKFGETKHVLVSGENIFIQNKKFRFTIVHDITELTLAQEALRESEEHFRAVFNIVGSGILLVNSETHEIIDVNIAAAKMIGLPIEEIKGRVCHNFICPNDAGDCPIKNMRIDTAMESPAKNGNEKVLIQANGERRQIIKSVFPISYQGVPCYVESFVDISELKKREKELQQLNSELTVTKDNLEKTNSEKDKFFSIIAHDLKNPFHGLLGISEILANDNESFDAEELSSLSKTLHDSAKKVYKLLENLLEWARMKNGRIMFTPIDLKASNLVLQNVELIRARAAQKGITIKTDVPSGISVHADEKMVNSILRNLLSNAVKFTTSGGEVSVVLEEENGAAKISVTDTGVGIEESDIRRLFKIEEKVSNKGTDGEPSTGLGLLLCKEFVDKHGGTLSVQSEVGKFSTFTFTLPIIG